MSYSPCGSTRERHALGIHPSGDCSLFGKNPSETPKVAIQGDRTRAGGSHTSEAHHLRYERVLIWVSFWVLQLSFFSTPPSPLLQ